MRTMFKRIDEIVKSPPINKKTSGLIPKMSAGSVPWIRGLCLVQQSLSQISSVLVYFSKLKFNPYQWISKIIQNAGPSPSAFSEKEVRAKHCISLFINRYVIVLWIFLPEFTLVDSTKNSRIRYWRKFKPWLNYFHSHLCCAYKFQ